VRRDRRGGGGAPAADPDDLDRHHHGRGAAGAAGGPGSASRATIGIVVIFGVAFSTLLSLFVVPAFYALLAPYTRSPEALGRRLDELEEQVAPVGGHA
jgi:hypothetical protein